MTDQTFRRDYSRGASWHAPAEYRTEEMAEWEALHNRQVQNEWERAERLKAGSPEFEAWKLEQIRREQEEIDANLAAGADLIVNYRGDQPPKIHTLTCQHMAASLDRSLAWSRSDYSAYAFDRGTSGPKMVWVTTRSDVEQLTRYERCRVCSPAVVESTPRRKPDDLAAQSLHERHLGRRLVTKDGVIHGPIVSYRRLVMVLTETGEVLLEHDERIRTLS